MTYLPRVGGSIRVDTSGSSRVDHDADEVPKKKLTYLGHTHRPTDPGEELGCSRWSFTRIRGIEELGTYRSPEQKLITSVTKVEFLTDRDRPSILGHTPQSTDSAVHVRYIRYIRYIS